MVDNIQPGLNTGRPVKDGNEGKDKKRRPVYESGKAAQPVIGNGYDNAGYERSYYENEKTLPHSIGGFHYMVKEGNIRFRSGGIGRHADGNNAEN